MPFTVKAYGAKDSKDYPNPVKVQRRDPGPKDVRIDIEYTGICHSDLHQVRNDWGNSIYPEGPGMVPGHEIIGKVKSVGSDVTRFKKGDLVGVGCLVDSCGECSACKKDHQQSCFKGVVSTYNGKEYDGTPTFGGYSEEVVVTENFVVHVPKNIYGPAVAPLLCAGVTTYAPLLKYGVGPGKRVGVVGLGGLGHMALKLARAMGAEDVALFSRSNAKEAEAKILGATRLIVSSDEQEMKANFAKFDVIIDTVPYDHDLEPYVNTLDVDGTLAIVGYVGTFEKPSSSLPLVFMDRAIAGSVIMGLEGTQKLLDFCSEKDILADIELVHYSQMKEAYDRLLKGDVHFRFVLDRKSIQAV